MPRSKQTKPETNGGSPATEESNSGGINPEPYTASWITIRDAAALANVTSQTVRNAYKAHATFNPPADDPHAVPGGHAWFGTKMVDRFGNATDFDVVYIDRDAVVRWIDARAAKPITGTHGGAKRYIIRLTPEQVASLPLNADGDQCVQLAVDGSLVKLEKPPVGNRKPKGNATTTDATDNPEDGVAADMPNAQQSDLFDVQLEEEVPA